MLHPVLCEGALLARSATRGLQLPVKKLLPTRAWRLDEKPPSLASLLHQPDSSNNSLITARRSVPQTYAPFSKCSERPSLAVLQRIAARAPRAAVITARATQLAEGVAAAMRRRRARASHIARDHRASETTHKKRPPTRVTQTSPRALQPTHTTKRAGPLPHEAGQPRPS